MLKYKIYSYFLKDLIKNYLIILFFLSFLIWLTQGGRFLDLITEHGVSVDIYAQYILLIFPKIVRQLILICFIISLFYTLSKFQGLNELNIYWLSGVKKIKIIKIIFFFGFLVYLFYIILSVFIAPYSSLKGRELIGKAEFKIINSLVKEKNFNSPLKNLNIYIEENDQKGNLKKIFIYEKDRTIIAKKGRVLFENGKFTLELIDGFTHEYSNGNIDIVKFNNTNFNISNYKSSIIDEPKFSERSIKWLFNEINSTQDKIYNNNLLEEINKRLIYPTYIYLLCIISSFVILKNFEKIGTEKFKALLFSLGVLTMILNEILLSKSGKDNYHTVLYLIVPIIFTSLLYIILKNVLKNENKLNI